MVEVDTLAKMETEVTESPIVRVAILGATGYAGRELIALLARHPAASVVRLMSSASGDPRHVLLEDAHPALRGLGSVPVQPLDLDEVSRSGAGMAFLATPHEVSASVAPELLGRGLRVVDLSGAFRLKDPESYPKWYGFEHHSHEALREAVYGVPEFNATAIRNAQLVANPGCYATSVILALAPLLGAGVVDLEAGIICDAKSGASGAGRALRHDLLFSNLNENCYAYSLFKHRHIPEMLQVLNLEERFLTFTPHLLPVTRGILSTIYLKLRRSAEPGDVENIFGDFYARTLMVRIYPSGKLPGIQNVEHTPYADIGWAFNAPSRRLILVSALDNLGKGAASQAVQNMNLMLGVPEETGLR
jgi:N-acetyl-gamma-glutamyl-phosphate reductase